MSNLRGTLTTAFNQLDQLEEKISAISQRSSNLGLSGTISTGYTRSLSSSDIESSNDNDSEVEERPLQSLKDVVEHEGQSDNSDLHTGHDTPSVLERPSPSLKDAVEHEDQSDNSDLHTGQDTPSVSERPSPSLKDAVHDGQSDCGDLHTGQDTHSASTMPPGMFGVYGFYLWGKSC